MSEPYSHFGDLIHRVQNEVGMIIRERYSNQPSCLHNQNPNQWIDIIELIKNKREKEFNNLFKKDIHLIISESIPKVIILDFIIKKIAWLFHNKSFLYTSDEDRFIDNQKPYTRKEFQDCVNFSYNYQLEILQSEETDLISEIKYAFINQIKKSDLQMITDRLITFRNERDWEQFHNPKDLALAISIESAELLELFLWKKADDASKAKVKEELADIFSFAFLLAEKYSFDVKDIILDKIRINGEKYPVAKAKGTAKKYDEL